MCVCRRPSVFARASVNGRFADAEGHQQQPQQHMWCANISHMRSYVSKDRYSSLVIYVLLHQIQHARGSSALAVPARSCTSYAVACGSTTDNETTPHETGISLRFYTYNDSTRSSAAFGLVFISVRCAHARV